MLPEKNETVRCSIKGKFKNEFNLKKDKLYKLNFVAVGDEVEFDMNQDGTGVIHSICERNNYLSRKAPKVKGAGYRGERLEQVIASNIDNLFIISSIAHPKFNNKAVDRIIVAGLSSRIDVILVINKTDIGNSDETEAWKELYSEIGYKVILSSVKEKKGLEEISALIKGKRNILWGHSGVGKSSIINALYPALNFKVGEISTSSQKGKHTTVTSIMTRTNENTSIIDTPGIREIDPYGITKENLCHYFREFLPLLDNCRFNTCTHTHEPGCAILEAVMGEKISGERYESYLYLLETIEEDMVF